MLPLEVRLARHIASTPVARPIRQARTAATRDRILAAAEAILAEGDGELTMECLAERAHVSVGALYKHFRGKDSLLPLVLERAHAQHARDTDLLLTDPKWKDVGLAGRIDGLLGAFASYQTAQRRLIRSLVLGYWQAPEQYSHESRAAELMGSIHAWLAECADEIRHPEPKLALALGLYTALQTLQSAILMERIPPSVGLERFTREQARMFKAYLGLPPAPAAAG